MKCVSLKKLSIAIGCALPVLSIPHAFANDIHFDYASFDNPGTPGASPHFGQSQFDVLNYPSLNGNFMMTSTDAHRPDMVVNGNALAQFYNNFLADYNTQYKNGALDAAGEADAINAYTNLHSTTNGPRPDWLILNEISTSVWQDFTTKGSDYRKWVIDAVTRLHDTYNYAVVTFSPFATVGANDPSWQALSAKSYIGVENYLSGAEVMNSGSTDAQREQFAINKYQASKNTYAAHGVDPSRLFMGEHFGNTIAGVGFGRAGISSDDWNKVIQLRQDAIRHVGFNGFLAYAWGSNTMHVTEAEQIEHEYYYRSRLVLPGQQPQWLSDNAINVNGTTVPLSWNQPLNWIGGMPDAPGAVANFYRTNTAARTITLDGAQTVGTLTFNSPSSYTLAAGTSGALTLDNGLQPASIVVSNGAHTITAPMTLAGDTTITIDPNASSLSITSDLAADGRAINKLGGGLLAIKNIRAGALSINAGKIAILPDGTPAGASRLDAIAINNGAQLDLSNNPLIITGAPMGTFNESNYDGVLGLVQSGRNGGAWDGSGIITSTATPGNNLTTLGVASASDVLGIGASETATWSGQSVHGSDTLVMYTYGGDANLDGKINIDDYGLIDSHVGQSGSAFGWHNGDFNYDGKINIDDYGIIDGNIGAQGAPLIASGSPAGGVIAVPEPSAIAFVAFASGIALRRRRKTA